MCMHRLFIYSTCGHSGLSPRPLILCRNACISPHSTFSTTCELLTHPYQSWKLSTLCPICEQRRVQLLARVEVTQVVRFDEWKWKVSYGMPAHGKDFWGRKAEEREREEREGRAKDGKKRKRFSLRRSPRKEREKEGGEES